MLLADYTINVHAIPMFLMGLITLGLGLLVYRSNRRSAAHRHFLALCGSIALWLSATSVGLCAPTPEQALTWFRIDNVGVMFISVAFYAFSAEFLQLHRPRSIRIGYGLAAVLALTVLFHPGFVSRVHRYWWGYFPQWGPASAPFFLVFLSYMAAAFTDYIRAYQATTTPIRRQQIKFVLMAFIIAYLGSVDFLPAFGFEIYPFGHIPIFLLTVVVTVAILRYHLLDAALFVSMSATYLPLVPFALLLVVVAHQLAQVAQNLIDNAIKYSPKGGAVTVELGEAATREAAIERAGRVWDGSARISLLTPSPTARAYAFLRVMDAGPGIPRRFLPRLGERFFRVLGSGAPGSIFRAIASSAKAIEL